MRKNRKIKSKLNAIRNSLDDDKNIADDIYDRYLQDLPSTDKLFGKKLDSFIDKRKKKRKNKKDIFSELIEIVETFVDSENQRASLDKNIVRQKIKRYALESLDVTVKDSKRILQENIVKIFFAGDGICGSNSTIPINSIKIKPKEIDFLDIFSISPDAGVGKIIYEPESPDIKKEKVNRNLYNTFSGSQYDFLKNDGGTLFTTNWDTTNQEFTISELLNFGSLSVNQFFDEYFSSVELPDISGITKTAMLLTIQGDGSETLQFNIGLNNLDRLLNKLFAVCGTTNDRSDIKKQNPTDLIDESEESFEFYFDFDDVDEVDFDSENFRIKKLLNFVDCNNFQAQANPSIIEDFVYLSGKKTLSDLVDETIEKSSTDAYEQSDKSIPLSQFTLSILNSFIKNLPKALVATILSPKLFLPIVVVYKIFKSITNELLDVKVMMKKLSKLFFNIIKDLFWKFITEFWTRIKGELMIFIRLVISKILKSKYKRYVTILTAIFEILKNVKNINIKSCDDLFDTILKTIETATTMKNGPQIPGFLLAFSDFLPGLSKQKMMIDVIEMLESRNIPTGPIYGERNNFIDAIDSVFDTLLQNIDKYGFVKGANKQTIIPSQSGPIVIPPGLLTITGKIF
jgi:hypothetical protein